MSGAKSPETPSIAMSSRYAAAYLSVMVEIGVPSALAAALILSSTSVMLRAYFNRP